VKKKEAKEAAAIAKRLAAAAAFAAKPRLSWGQSEVETLTKAAFKAADQGKSDGQISKNEMTAYLPGSPYRQFGDWICRERPPMGRPLFKDFAGPDGELDEEELQPAVLKYLEEHSVEPGVVLQESKVASEIVASEVWLEKHLRRMEFLRAKRAAEVKLIVKKHRTQPADIEVLADAIFSKADMDGGGEVSGNELHNNLTGSPYEQFTRWAVKGRTAPFKKFDNDGGGSIGREEMGPLVALYLGTEMTAVGRQMTVEAYRWREKCQKAEKKRQSEAEAHRESLRSTLQACRMPQAGALLHATLESVEHWVEEVFAQAQSRKMLYEGKQMLSSLDLGAILHNTQDDQFGWWVRTQNPSNFVIEESMFYEGCLKGGAVPWLHREALTKLYCEFLQARSWNAAGIVPSNLYFKIKSPKRRSLSPSLSPKFQFKHSSKR